jgi:hypothetical protein
MRTGPQAYLQVADENWKEHVNLAAYVYELQAALKADLERRFAPECLSPS